MDKNSIIGFSIIAVLLVAFTIINQPTQEELEIAKQKRDSIARVEKAKKELINNELSSLDESIDLEDTGSVTNTTQVTENFTIVENDLIKLSISNYGGKISNIELKKYQSFNGKDAVRLWDENKAKFELHIGQQGHVLNTNKLVFVPTQPNDSTLIMTSQTSTGSRISYIYKLPKNSYEVGFDIQLDNLQSNLGVPANMSFFWAENLIANEKGRSFENRYTSIYYKEEKGDVRHVGDDSEKTPEKKLEWIAFKTRFFSSVLIPETPLSPAKMKVSKFPDDSPFLKRTVTEIPLDYRGTNSASFLFKFYFGPNEYKTLRKYGKNIDLQELIDLGWGPIAWVNRFVVVEIFNLLEKYVTGSYGIIILLLTIIIKLVLSPLTYKSYISSAKMRVLKPQIEEINERIPKEKAMERQQATMELYRKAGVNPLGGCIPMLVQMPILFAMFYFFPVAIQLRQKSFLWAQDLSSYDNIANLPFNIPFYGDHVSLFCLLMAIANLVYTYINMQNQPANSQPGMPNMKYMMYLMPIIFLGVFNQYPSGLSYYYFIATLFTIIQTIIIREFMIDDKKLLATLEANKAKPQKPKSKFRQRLEQMQKEQMKQQKLRNK